jgi:ankyrin repeat protein
MHIAARNGLQNTVAILLREDPDSLDELDSSLQSPTLLAAKHGFSKLVLYLLEKKANCGLQDKQGRTAFDWAVKLKHSAVVKVFFDTFDLQRLKKVMWRIIYPLLQPLTDEQVFYDKFLYDKFTLPSVRAYAQHFL